jgi:hypothetical protein
MSSEMIQNQLMLGIIQCLKLIKKPFEKS